MGKLTDKGVQAAQPREKQYGVSDGDSLSLIIRPSGAKLWWFRYRYGGKAKTLSIGVYPIVSLREARDKVFESKKKLANNIDPSAEKLAVRAAIAEQKEEQVQNEGSAFEIIARDWFEKHRKSLGWEDNHSSKILNRLESDIFPWLGKRPIAGITASELLVVIRKIEARGALETAHRALSECGRVF